MAVGFVLTFMTAGAMRARYGTPFGTNLHRLIDHALDDRAPASYTPILDPPRWYGWGWATMLVMSTSMASTPGVAS